MPYNLSNSFLNVDGCRLWKTRKNIMCTKRFLVHSSYNASLFNSGLSRNSSVVGESNTNGKANFLGKLI